MHTCIVIQSYIYIYMIHTYIHIYIQNLMNHYLPCASIIFLCLFVCTTDGEYPDQLFIDACKGVIRRCIFLLLGVCTSFPVDSELLSLIASASKVAQKETFHDLPEDRSPHAVGASSTPSTGSPPISPRSDVGVVMSFL